MRMAKRLTISRAIVLGFIVFTVGSACFSQTTTTGLSKWTNRPSFVRISPKVADALLIKKVKPVDPRKQGDASAVVLAARIDAKGRVIELAPLSGNQEL